MAGMIRRLWAPVAVIMVGVVWLGCANAYLPHVDDLFEIAWAKAVATGSSETPHELSRFLATPEYFVNAPRLHIYLLAGFFNALGGTPESVLTYRAFAYFVSAAIVAVAALRNGLPLLAVLFPAVLCIVMLHTGLRPEGTALILYLAGFVLLFDDGAEPGAFSFFKRTSAKALIILAPLAAPSALAYGIGLLLVSDVRDLKRRSIGILAAEDIVALSVGVIALGAMANFDYPEFIRVYTTSAQEVDLASFNVARLINGLLLMALGAAVWRRSRVAGFAGVAIGAGAAISFVLHNKISISTPLSACAIFAVADAFSRDTRWQKLVVGLSVVIVAVLAVNQLIFAFGSQHSAEARSAVRAFAKQAQMEGRPLLVDEIAAIHGLGLSYGDAYAWSYSEAHPNVRPLSIERIRDGESWIVSAYTIHGWLKSEAVAGFPPKSAPEAAVLPGVPCLMGRNSCRLPVMRWGYYLVERRNGDIAMRVVP